MELLSVEWFSALLSIILIDLVLAGDNAIVIGMAARNVPKDNQRKVIFWGTAGAIVIRIISTIAVVWLLKIPGLLAAGGLLLLWIAYKLLADDKDHEIEAKNSVMAAIRTIIIADAVMGIDNVLAVAGASHGSFLLVVIGLLVSVPIVVWGSTLFITLVKRFPIIVYAGAGVLAFTAIKMIMSEPILKGFTEDLSWGKWIVVAAGVAATLWLGKRKKDRSAVPAHGQA
ncbi:TerC family protein [Gorillibacterium sp. sgz5001074]|uniref:TerC family protein n=1 Tax=Gorillibacterium sp. sgz5001074 TaxID=3446695 RepID=UPI003F664CDE